jgi:hypothetical protein
MFLRLFLERNFPLNQCRLPMILPLPKLAPSPIFSPPPPPCQLSPPTVQQQNLILSISTALEKPALSISLPGTSEPVPQPSSPLSPSSLPPFRCHLGFQPCKLMSSKLLLFLFPRLATPTEVPEPATSFQPSHQLGRKLNSSGIYSMEYPSYLLTAG